MQEIIFVRPCFELHTRLLFSVQSFTTDGVCGPSCSINGVDLCDETQVHFFCNVDWYMPLIPLHNSLNNFQIEMTVNIFMEKYPIIKCLIERMKDGILEELDVTQVLQIFAEMLSPENIFGPEMVSKNIKS